MNDAATPTPSQSRVLVWMHNIFRTDVTPLTLDVALSALRIGLAWIFIYYGAGKLFGAFNGPGIHRTAIFFSESAHLRPGGLFAVLGGVIEFGGGVAMAFGFSSRLAAAALFGDQVMAMITISWARGINSLTNHPGYEFNLALTVMALAVVALGPGRLSLDHLLQTQLQKRRSRFQRSATDVAPRASSRG